jgi:hypothetical protein
VLAVVVLALGLGVGLYAAGPERTCQHSGPPTRPLRSMEGPGLRSESVAAGRVADAEGGDPATMDLRR